MSLPSGLNLILHDDRITRGLDDAEARMLIDWLIARAEMLQRDGADQRAMESLYRGARLLARFVALWCYESNHGGFGAALQLAATERFGWPLPAGPMDACDLMCDILQWETAHALVRRGG